jgi:hypothetical protein
MNDQAFRTSFRSESEAKKYVTDDIKLSMLLFMQRLMLGILTAAMIGVTVAGLAQPAFAQAAPEPKPALTAAQAAAALDNFTLDPAEKDILIRFFSDSKFRKAQAVVPVLKPTQNGDLVRCTLEPASQFPGAVVAYFDKKGDQMRASGFQTFSSLSILRFSGTVRFPFTTPAPSADPSFRINGYLGRDEEWAKNGRRSSNLLMSISLASDTATFTGVPGDPLTFILLPEGLVYIHGTGTVTYHGSTKHLGTVPKSAKVPPK